MVQGLKDKRNSNIINNTTSSDGVPGKFKYIERLSTSAKIGKTSSRWITKTTAVERRQHTRTCASVGKKHRSETTSMV